MTFATMAQYVEKNLADDTARYLNGRSNSFSGYFGLNNYFNEDTVKTVMSRLLTEWIAANDTEETAMVFSELHYTGFDNRADIGVVYLTENGRTAPTKTLYIELKTDFSVDSVNGDVNILDLIAGAGNSPITSAYAFYTVFEGQEGWTRYIEAPTQPNVHTVGIPVTSP
ncbi:hypothetical protein [Microbulbifer rhizosphaerae]|uniref:Uncharacterized protein n=1 Tax=Microbulbifer rhizosphaerae TaxID=1562603 RepID=A0A7W4W9F7_9GAMM|nr:hypothetical protein [Microbulbifer rhizosphaerae]MBB3059558.1 hypothetical protein [Microbulbifer rhizosphaerae]